MLEKYFLKKINPLREEPKSKLIDYLGWQKQNENSWFIGIPLLSGRLSGRKKSVIRQIVEKYSLDLRVTPNQDILLCNIANKSKKAITSILEGIGYGNLEDINEIERHALACPALPLCGLAITEAERILPDILKRIDKMLNNLRINKTILFRMTGCPNGCSRPYMAELALVGSGLNQYQLWLGGSKNLQRLAKPYIQRMSLDDLEVTIEPLLIEWEKSSFEIDFGDFVSQQKDSFIINLLSQSK